MLGLSERGRRGLWCGIALVLTAGLTHAFTVDSATHSANPTQFVTESTVEISGNLQFSGANPNLFVIVYDLPEGWSYVDSSGTASSGSPNFSFNDGADQLSVFFFGTPTSPLTFSFDLDVPADADADVDFHGEVQSDDLAAAAAFTADPLTVTAPPPPSITANGNTPAQELASGTTAADVGNRVYVGDSVTFTADVASNAATPDTLDTVDLYIAPATWDGSQWVPVTDSDNADTTWPTYDSTSPHDAQEPERLFLHQPSPGENGNVQTKTVDNGNRFDWTTVNPIVDGTYTLTWDIPKTLLTRADGPQVYVASLDAEQDNEAYVEYQWAIAVYPATDDFADSANDAADWYRHFPYEESYASPQYAWFAENATTDVVDFRAGLLAGHEPEAMLIKKGAQFDLTHDFRARTDVSVTATPGSDGEVGLGIMIGLPTDDLEAYYAADLIAMDDGGGTSTEVAFWLDSDEGFVSETVADMGTRTAVTIVALYDASTDDLTFNVLDPADGSQLATHTFTDAFHDGDYVSTTERAFFGLVGQTAGATAVAAGEATADNIILEDRTDGSGLPTPAKVDLVFDASHASAVTDDQVDIDVHPEDDNGSIGGTAGGGATFTQTYDVGIPFTAVAPRENEDVSADPFSQWQIDVNNDGSLEEPEANNVLSGILPADTGAGHAVEAQYGLTLQSDLFDDQTWDSATWYNYSGHPDLELQETAAGRLGVVADSPSDEAVAMYVMRSQYIFSDTGLAMRINWDLPDDTLSSNEFKSVFFGVAFPKGQLAIVASSSADGPKFEIIGQYVDDQGTTVTIPENATYIRPRAATGGAFFICYDPSFDRLYLGHNRYFQEDNPGDPDDGVWTFDGIILGDDDEPLNDRLVPFFGGEAQDVALDGTTAYLDNWLLNRRELGDLNYPGDEFANTVQAQYTDGSVLATADGIVVDVSPQDNPTNGTAEDGTIAGGTANSFDREYDNGVPFRVNAPAMTVDGSTFLRWDYNVQVDADGTMQNNTTTNRNLAFERVFGTSTYTAVYDQRPQISAAIGNDTKDEDSADFDYNLDSFFSDLEDGNLDYTASSNNTDVVTVVHCDTVGDPNQLRLGCVNNAYGQATITVRATDDEGGYVEQSFIITVDPVNDEPGFTKGPNQEVNEDAGLQTVNGWATNLDKGAANESGQTFSFHVDNDDNTLFAVQPAIDASGTLTYTPADDANGSATVTVSVQDDGGTDNGGDDESPDQTFTITVQAVNDAPSFTKGADQSVNEDAGGQEAAGWATALSAGPADEAAQTLQFNVSNDNNALFSTQPAIDATGKLTYTPADDAFGSATVTVSNQDDGGTANGGVDESADQTFTIEVLSVNDVPSFTKGANQTVDEDSGLQTVPGWVAASSKGPANESDQTLSFPVSGNTNPGLFATPPVINGDGQLTYTPAADANGSATVTVKVRDDGGVDRGGVDESAGQTFSITVNALNDPPTLTPGGNVSVNEDSGAYDKAWFTPGTLVAGPQDEQDAGQTVTLNTDNDSNGLFSVQPAVDKTTGKLSFTPADDVSGTATVTVTATDDGATGGAHDNENEYQFTITVEQVNDEPSFTKGPDQDVNEDAGAQNVANWTTDISAGPVDEAGQNLTITIWNDSNGLFSAQPSLGLDGTLTYTPADDANGSATVTVRLQDDGGTANGGDDTFADQTFTITVQPVNDPPDFTAGADETVAEDAGLQTVPGWATNLDKGPADEDGQTLDFQVNNTNNGLFAVQPAISSDGDLTYTPADDAFGSATVSVRLKDDGGTANGGADQSALKQFTITVTALNDGPVIGQDPYNFTVDERTAVGTNVGDGTVGNDGIVDVTDEENNALTYELSGTNSDLFAIDGNGQITVNGDLDFETLTPNPVVLTVTVTDDGTTNGVNDFKADTATVNITVDDINDPPVATDTAAVVQPGTNPPPIDITLTITDQDSAVDSVEGATDKDSTFNVFDGTLVVTNTTEGGTAVYKSHTTGPGNQLNLVVTYTAPGGTDIDESFSDTFVIRAIDEQDGPAAEDPYYSVNADDADSALATVTITSNQLPVITRTDSETGPYQETGSYTFSISADDPDDDDTITQIDVFIGGTKDEAQSMTYAPGANVQAFSFTYEPDYDVVDHDDPTPTVEDVELRLEVTDSRGGKKVFRFPNGGDSDTITVNDRNRSPVLDDTGEMALTGIQEDDTNPAGNTVQSIIDSSAANGGNAVTDADEDPEGIVIVGIADGNGGGTWQFDKDADGTWVDMELTTSWSSAIALSGTAKVRFVPDPDWNDTFSSPAPGIRFRAWDGLVGQNGQTDFDASTYTDGVSISLNWEDARIAVAAVNDKPVNTAAPTVTGTHLVAQQLGITAGIWNDDIDQGTIQSLTYEWQRADDDAGTGTAPVGAGATYDIGTADAHKFLRVVETATDNGAPAPSETDTAATAWTQIGNTAPVAQADRPLTVTEDDQNVDLGITAPTDADDDALTITVTAVPAPAKGEVTKNGSDTALAVSDTLTSAELTGLLFDAVADATGAAGTFAYTVDDGYTGTDTQTITITITPVNDAPVIGQDDYAFTVPENSPQGTKVGDGNDGNGDEVIDVTDTENDGLTYELTGTNSDLFAIDGNGRITVDGDLDFETLAPNPVVLTVTVTDDGTTNGGDDHRQDTATVTIDVTDVNDAPQAADVAASVLPAPDTAPVDIQISVFDPDTPVDAVEGHADGSGAFTALAGVATFLSEQGGTVAFKSRSDTQPASHLSTVTVTYTPPAGQLDETFVDTFVYRGVDTQAGPAGEDPYRSNLATVTIRADQLPTFDVATSPAEPYAEDDGPYAFHIEVSDPDVGDTIVQIDWFVDGTKDETQSGAIPVQQQANSATSGFSYEPGFDTVVHPATTAEVEIRVDVTDSRGGVASYRFPTGAADDTVTVNDTNQLPFVENALADQGHDEDDNVPDLDLTTGPVFGDDDTEDPALFTYSVVNVVQTPAGGHGTLFDTADIAMGTSVLDIDLTANAFGTATITVQAEDGVGAQVQTDLAITVDPVNDQPTVPNPIADQNDVNEDDTDRELNLWTAFDDVEDDDSELTFAATSGNTNLVVPTVDNTNGTVSLDFQLDASGATDITVTCTDTGGLQRQDSFQITVAPVNDTPVPDDASYYTKANRAPADDNAAEITPGAFDPDDDPADLTFTIESLPAESGTGAVAGTLKTSGGTLLSQSDEVTSADFPLRFRPNDNLRGLVTFEVSVRDDEGADSNDLADPDQRTATNRITVGTPQWYPYVDLLAFDPNFDNANPGLYRVSVYLDGATPGTDAPVFQARVRGQEAFTPNDYINQLYEGLPVDDYFAVVETFGPGGFTVLDVDPNTEDLPVDYPVPTAAVDGVADHGGDGSAGTDPQWETDGNWNFAFEVRSSSGYDLEITRPDGSKVQGVDADGNALPYITDHFFPVGESLISPDQAVIKRGVYLGTRTGTYSWRVRGYNPQTPDGGTWEPAGGRDFVVGAAGAPNAKPNAVDRNSMFPGSNDKGTPGYAGTIQGDAATTNIFLRWSGIPDAAWYYVYLISYGNEIIVNRVAVPSTKTSYGPVALGPGKYTWYVVVRNEQGLSTWSLPRYFLVEGDESAATPVPVLNSVDATPAAGQVDVATDWEIRGTHVQVWIGSSVHGGFTETIALPANDTVTVDEPDFVEPNREYVYQVRGWNGDVPGQWSAFQTYIGAAEEGEGVGKAVLTVNWGGQTASATATDAETIEFEAQTFDHATGAIASVDVPDADPGQDTALPAALSTAGRTALIRARGKRQVDGETVYGEWSAWASQRN